MAYVDTEKLKRNIRVNLMPNVDVDGTVTVENAERFFLDLIEKTSTSDVAEVKHGEWIDTGKFDFHATPIYQCSVCQKEVADNYINLHKYCLHCGAKMDGGVQECQ